MKKKFLKSFMSTLIITTIAFSFVACNQKAVNNTQKEKSGKIILGTSADYPPFEFHKEINGKDEIVGFDISIAKEIAKDLGQELEIKDMGFDGLLAALNSGNVDFVMAGMNSTEERKLHADFSKIYYSALQTVIIREEDKDKIKSINDLSGKKVGAQQGAVQATIAKEQIKNAEIKELGKIPDLILELKNKKIDALIVESPVAKAYINKNKTLIISDLILQNEDNGFSVAIKKGQTELVNKINNSIDRLNNEKAIETMFIEATDLSE